MRCVFLECWLDDLMFSISGLYLAFNDFCCGYYIFDFAISWENNRHSTEHAIVNHQFSADPGCCLQNCPNASADLDEWRASKRNRWSQDTLMMICGLMACQFSLVIWRQTQPCRKTAVIQFNQRLGDRKFIRFSKVVISRVKVIACIEFELGGARGVMVIVVGNGHGDTSSNPGQDW